NFDKVREIVRVNKVTRAPPGYVLHRLAEILQKCSIEHLGCTIRRESSKKAGHVVQQGARIEFSRMQRFLSPPAIVDVSKEQIPRGYLVFRISHRETADLEPSVNAVGAAAAVLNLIDLPRLDRLFARLDYTRKVVWMNCAEEGPVLQLFTCPAEI